MSGDTLVANELPRYHQSLVGKALVFQRGTTGWDLDSELTVEGDWAFPEGLAMEGDRAWFGVLTTEPRSQHVYAFQRTNGSWGQAQKLSFPDFGENEIASWGFQDGTFVIGFWNGLRTESVQLYRAAGDERSDGSTSSQGGTRSTTKGSSCSFAPSHDGRVGGLAVLALAVVLARKRRTARTDTEPR